MNLRQQATHPTASSARSDGRRSRWEQHRQERRRELLRAARAAVHDLGPQASMDEIAHHAGTSKSVFYRYFKDKNGLQAAVGERAVEFMERELIQAAQGSESALDGLHNMVTVYLTLAESSPNVYAFSTQVLGENGSTETAHFFKRIGAVMDARFRDHLAQDGHLPDAVSATWYWPYGAIGMVRAAGEAWLQDIGGTEPHQRPTAEHLAHTITTWLTVGLTTTVQPSGADSRRSGVGINDTTAQHACPTHTTAGPSARTRSPRKDATPR